MRSAIGKHSARSYGATDPSRGPRQQDRDGLQVCAPPRKARLEGRQIQGIDGRGHGRSVFTIFVSMKTPSAPPSSALLGVLFAVVAAMVFSTAGVIVRRIDLPAWDVSFWRSALLVITMLPLLHLAVPPANPGSTCAMRGPALLLSAVLLAGSFVSLHPGARSRARRQRADHVRRDAVHHRDRGPHLPRREPLHGHTVFAMAVAVVGLAISVAGSLQPGALAGMAVALIVVLCMSGNYVVVRHRRDIGMTPSIWLAGVISGLVALPFAHPENVTWSQLPWLFALSPGQLAVGLLLYMASLKRIPAAQASLARPARTGPGSGLGVAVRWRKAGRSHLVWRRHRHLGGGGQCVAGFAAIHWLRTGHDPEYQGPPVGHSRRSISPASWRAPTAPF